MKRLRTVVFLALGGLALQVLGIGDEKATLVVVGALCLVAAAYGLFRYGPDHATGWRQVWRAQSLGLVLVIGAGVARQLSPAHLPGGSGAALSLLADAAVMVGLIRMIRLRLPGRAGQLLLEGAAPVAAIGLVVWTLVVEPAGAGRWSTGVSLIRLAVPLMDALLLWQLLQLMAVTTRSPVAYKYLAGAFTLLLVGDGLRAGAMLGHGGLLPVQANNVPQLWAWALWAVAVMHPSQRRAFPAVPSRNVRTSGLRVAAVVSCIATGPALFVALPVLGRHLHTSDLVAGAALVPALVVAYLVSQVYSRANAEYHAQHDVLTGLCNRALFEYHLESAIAVARRSGTQVGVMFLDIDRFKGVNDSLGHAVGNDLLRSVAQRVEHCVRDNDLVARMGGDEFTVLLPDVNGRGVCMEVAERVLDAFSRPFKAGTRQLAVTTSIGVAMFPGDGDDAESLLKNADTAMYRAKAAGRNTAEAYDSDMSARAHVRFALENSLRAAMQKGELTVFYQPRVEIASGRIAGVEALARWHHRRLGFISPFAFVSLAEETGLIAPLGEWVLEAACRQARAWSAAGLGPVPVSVNMSPQQFNDRPMVDMVTEVLGKTGLDPELLELELTESLFMQDRIAVVDNLAALREIGVRCSIDDFGTGYSALSYLADIPMDTLKIDQSFVRRIEAGDNDATLVGAVISLAHSLGLSVVAEGVETEVQLAYLLQSGCEQAQGYIYSPALPAPTVELILRRQKRSDETGAAIGLWNSTSGEAHFDDPAALSLDPLVKSVTSPQRMAHVLHSLCQDGPDTADLDGDTVEAILAALQGDVVSGIGGSIRSRSAKIAAGTLAGLVPLGGGMAGAGYVPGSWRGIAAALNGGLGVQPPGTPDQSSQTLALTSEEQAVGAPAGGRTHNTTPGARVLADSGEGASLLIDIPAESPAATAGVLDGSVTPAVAPAVPTSSPVIVTAVVVPTHVPAHGPTGSAGGGGAGSPVPAGAGAGHPGGPGGGGGNPGNPGGGAGNPGHPGNGGGAGNPGNPGNGGGAGIPGNPGNGGGAGNPGNGGAGNPGAGGGAGTPGNPGNGGGAGNPGNGGAGNPGAGGGAGNPGNPGNGGGAGNPGNGGAGNPGAGGGAGNPGGGGGVGNPGNPGNGGGAGNPGNPGGGGGVGNPGNPGNGGAGNPGNPGGGAGGAGNPGNPGNGGGAGNPGNPGNGGGAGNPGNGGAGNPGAGGGAGNPGGPSNGGGVGNTGNPGAGGGAGNAGNPGAGGGPANPGNPGKGGGTSNPNAGGGTSNPNAGGGASNPNGGGGAASPNGGGGSANPGKGGGTSNPNAGGGTSNPNAGGGTNFPIPKR